MSTDIVTMRPDATVRDAARLMAAKGIGSVVITESGVLRGLFTHYDIVLRAAESADPETSLRDAMGDQIPVTVTIDMGTDDVAKLMCRTRQDHVLVLDKAGHWVGLVSSWDLAKEMTQKSGASPYTPEYIQALRQDFARH